MNSRENGNAGEWRMGRDRGVLPAGRHWRLQRFEVFHRLGVEGRVAGGRSGIRAPYTRDKMSKTGESEQHQ